MGHGHEANIRGGRKNVHVGFKSVQKPAVERGGGAGGVQ
jgi:hypothetical protein